MLVKRLFPLSGLAFVALVLIAVIGIGGSTPGPDESAAELATFYDDEVVRQGIASFVIAASSLFLVLFGIGLTAAYGDRQRRLSPWELVLFAGTVLAAGGVLLVAFVHFALANAVDEGIRGGALEALNVADGNTWMLFNPALGVMMLGAAGLLLRRDDAYKWAGRMSLVLGVALFVPFADFVAMAITLVWIAVMGVATARGSSRVEARLASEAAAATGS